MPRHVAPSNFSYQTVTADDPRNLLVVFTPTGWYVHVDGVGDTALLANEVTPDGTLRERWFEVSATDVAVGGPVESKSSPPRPPSARGRPPLRRATPHPPVEIGIRGSGPRTNRMLVVSIPQASVRRASPVDGHGRLVRRRAGDVPQLRCPDHDEPLVAEGVARMANLALGEIVGERDVRKTTVRVDTDEPVVVTQIDYNTISLPHGGGMRATVGKSDVEAAIRDMERQYTLCDAACKLSQLHAMLHHWTQETASASPPLSRRRRPISSARCASARNSTRSHPGERAPALLSEARGDEGTRGRGGRGDEGTRGRGEETASVRACSIRRRFFMQASSVGPKASVVEVFCEDCFDRCEWFLNTMMKPVWPMSVSQLSTHPSFSLVSSCSALVSLSFPLFPRPSSPSSLLLPYSRHPSTAPCVPVAAISAVHPERRRRRRPADAAPLPVHVRRHLSLREHDALGVVVDGVVAATEGAVEGRAGKDVVDTPLELAHARLARGALEQPFDGALVDREVRAGGGAACAARELLREDLSSLRVRRCGELTRFRRSRRIGLIFCGSLYVRTNTHRLKSASTPWRYRSRRLWLAGRVEYVDE